MKRIIIGLLMIFGLAVTGRVKATETPIANWKLDETTGTIASDSAVNGYHGTLVNGPVWSSGKIQGALNFDGINDYVTLVDDPLDLTGSMTISGWIYVNDVAKTRHIISKNQNGTASPWQLAILTSGRLRSYTKGTLGEEFIDSVSVINLNAWNHIVFVRDATTLQVTFYINGIQDAGGWKTFTPGKIAVSAVTAKIGSRGDGNANYFLGKTDEMAIYDKVLTGTDVADLYNAGAVDIIPPTIPENLTAEAISAGEIALMWNTSTDNLGVAGYKIYRNSNFLTSVSSAGYTDVNLPPDTVYSYNVSAVDALGNESGRSTTATATTFSLIDTSPPQMENQAVAEITESSVVITWETNEKSDSMVEYGVSQNYGNSTYRNPELLTLHEMRIVNLDPATVYHFRVVSADLAGNRVQSADGQFTTLTGGSAVWRFDETSGPTAGDSSGNGNTGTLTNGPVWTGGKILGGLNFDGINDYVTVTDDPLDLTGSMTISAWVYTPDFSKVRQIVSKNKNGVSSPWQLGILTSGKLRSYTKGSGGIENIDSNKAITVNAWNHVVFVRDGTTQKITFYINGVQDTGGWKPYDPAKVAASTVTAKIGSRGDGNANYFLGKMDSVRLYNRVLNAAEVTNLYRETDDRISPTIQITGPNSGSEVLGTIAIGANATDETSIGRVAFYKNGVFLGTTSLVPFKYIWSTALGVNGNYQLTAVASDTAGNNRTSETINVTVNNPQIGNKPNVVIVITDDQRFDTLQYMPILNAQLFSESVRFNNTFASVPLCCPSRATIFTGLYAHNHGIIDNAPPYGGAPMFKDSSTIATWLKNGGYRTGLFGKYMNSYDQISPYIPPGWDQWFAFVQSNNNYLNYKLNENGTVVTYGNQPADYSTEVIAKKAVNFVENTSSGQPVFVYLASFAPHSTGSAFDSLPTPAASDSGSFANLLPWRPAAFNENDVSDKPTWVKKLLPLTDSQIVNGDNFRIKQIESLQAVDRAVGEMVDVLKRTNRYDNTVFVFMSDNGMTWGEHRWMDKKWCGYDECVRIPFWIRVPGITGRDEATLINDVDLAPTLAELAGVIPASKINGASMYDVIKNPAAAWKPGIFTEYISPAYGGVQMIFREFRTKNYKYIQYDNGDKEFYDLTADPSEEVNRIGETSFLGEINSLAGELQILRVE